MGKSCAPYNSWIHGFATTMGIHANTRDDPHRRCTVVGSGMRCTMAGPAHESARAWNHRECAVYWNRDARCVAICFGVIECVIFTRVFLRIPTFMCTILNCHVLGSVLSGSWRPCGRNHSRMCKEVWASSQEYFRKFMHSRQERLKRCIRKNLRVLPAVMCLAEPVLPFCQQALRFCRERWRTRCFRCTCIVCVHIWYIASRFL